MRVYVGMNVSGQMIITAGILSGDLSIFNSFTTIGITLLAASVVCLWSPALTIFKNNSDNGKKVGPFSYALRLILPIIGIFTMACWALRDEFESALDSSERILFDLFFSLSLVARLFSHINRDWIGKSYNLITQERCLEYMPLCCWYLLSQNHSMKQMTYQLRVVAVLQLLPYLFIFIMLKP